MLVIPQKGALIFCSIQVYVSVLIHVFVMVQLLTPVLHISVTNSSVADDSSHVMVYHVSTVILQTVGYYLPVCMV